MTPDNTSHEHSEPNQGAVPTGTPHQNITAELPGLCDEFFPQASPADHLDELRKFSSRSLGGVGGEPGVHVHVAALVPDGLPTAEQPLAVEAGVFGGAPGTFVPGLDVELQSRDPGQCETPGSDRAESTARDTTPAMRVEHPVPDAGTSGPDLVLPEPDRADRLIGGALCDDEDIDPVRSDAQRGKRVKAFPQCICVAILLQRAHRARRARGRGCCGWSGEGEGCPLGTDNGGTLD